MIEQVLKGIFAGLRALAIVAPEVAALFSEDLDGLEERAFERLAESRYVSEEWEADLQRRIAEAGG